MDNGLEGMGQDVAALPDGSGCFVLEIDTDDGFTDFLAADEDTGDIDPLTLAIGILVELERSGGFEEAEAAALAHLGEDECYYGECPSEVEADDFFVPAGDGIQARVSDTGMGGSPSHAGLGVPSVIPLEDRFEPSDVTQSVCPHWADKLRFYLVRSAKRLSNGKWAFRYGDLRGEYDLSRVVGGYMVDSKDNIAAFPNAFQTERQVCSYFNLGGDRPKPYKVGSALYYFIDDSFVPLNRQALDGYGLLRSCWEGGDPDRFMDSYRREAYKASVPLSAAFGRLDIGDSAYRKAQGVPLFSDAEVEEFMSQDLPEGLRPDAEGWVAEARQEQDAIAEARAYFDAAGIVPSFKEFEAYLQFAGCSEDDAKSLYDGYVAQLKADGEYPVDDRDESLDSRAWRLFTQQVKASKPFRDAGLGTGDAIALNFIKSDMGGDATFSGFLRRARLAGLDLTLDQQDKIVKSAFNGDYLQEQCMRHDRGRGRIFSWNYWDSHAGDTARYEHWAGFDREDEGLDLDEAVDEVMAELHSIWPWFADFEDTDAVRDWVSEGPYQEGVDGWGESYFEDVVFDPKGDWPDIYVDCVCDLLIDRHEEDVADWLRDHCYDDMPLDSGVSMRHWAMECLKKHIDPESAVDDVYFLMGRNVESSYGRRSRLRSRYGRRSWSPLRSRRSPRSGRLSSRRGLRSQGLRSRCGRRYR